MYEAASLGSIKHRVASKLSRKANPSSEKLGHEWEFMAPQMVNCTVGDQMLFKSEQRHSMLVGILLCHPHSPLAKSEILGHLPFFHFRSGEAIDFFCAGYGAYWPLNHYADKKVVAQIGEEKWLFSDKAFSDIISELESESDWIYSGETELLLLPAARVSNKAILGFESALVCNLEMMSKDQAFTSVRSFFDSIFRYAKDGNVGDSIWDFSDGKGLDLVGEVVKSVVLSLLPNKVAATYRQASHYAVRNIANHG